MKLLLPTTSSTGAVSPITRATASMTPVVMPVDAVGSTTRRIVFHFGTPRAYDASRSELGTSRIISSEVRTMIGSSRIASANEPAKPVNALVERDEPERQDEQAGDDRRDAGHDVDQEAHGGGEARAAVLGDVDRDHQAERHRDERWRSAPAQRCR